MEYNLIREEIKKKKSETLPVSTISYIIHSNELSITDESDLNDEPKRNYLDVLTESKINNSSNITPLSTIENNNSLKNSNTKMQQIKKNTKGKRFTNNNDQTRYLNSSLSLNENNNNNNNNQPVLSSVRGQLNATSVLDLCSPDKSSGLNNQIESGIGTTSAIKTKIFAKKTENNEINISCQKTNFIQLDNHLNDPSQNESTDEQITNTNNQISSSISNNSNANSPTNSINTDTLLNRTNSFNQNNTTNAYKINFSKNNENTQYQNFNLDTDMNEKSIYNDKPSLIDKTINNSNDNTNFRNKSYLYRSTPNLNEIKDHDINNIINNSQELNQNRYNTDDFNKLKSYPSNLELSTNLKENVISNHQLELEFDRSANYLNKFSTNSLLKVNFKQRYKLIAEGDVHICKLPNSKNVISKILNSKILRRWKSHRILLTDTEIYSPNKSDYMDKNIPYHSIVEISPISKWDPGQKCYFRIATLDCHYLFQTNNAFTRDQWIHSILWKKHKFKSERVLRNADRLEIVIKEIKSVIDLSLTTPIDDKEIYNHPLEIVSEILQKHNLPKQTHEDVIVGLSPLLEKNHPSPEICEFFSKHCRDSPRSHIVIEMFTPVVQRILKHNGDFGKYPHMRLFVQNYLMALMAQNDGIQTVQNFVVSMHSLSSQCPFPRVLPNFVAVCLSAIHSCFDTYSYFSKSKLVNIQSETNQIASYQLDKEEQMICYTTMMHTMSKFEDWRAHLAQLLQSKPFLDKALTNQKFIRIFKKVVENFAQDTRCEVHLTLLGIREGKEGWFDVFAPGGMSCNDDGELFASMLQRLVGCCCKKKRFLLSINKFLFQIIELALREKPCAIETLCAMLDLDGIENLENKPQIIKALQSTQLGLSMYSQVLERQIKLKELQKKGGPRKLTLPSRSTDEDLAKLLLSGSFGNLECLSLAFTNVTSACAEYLIRLPSLRYLNLWSTKFGDEGLELISEHLQRLQVLNLCETPVTDKGLACLASMKQLRKLNLNSTNLSELTFEGLKECLPALQECDIRYTDAW